MERLVLKGFLVEVLRGIEVVEEVHVLDLAAFAKSMTERRKEDPSLSYRICPMSTPEDWGKVVKSYGKSHQPEIIWFISHATAKLTLADELDLLRADPKVILDIAWLDSGILVIVWACGSENGVTEILTELARKCGIPTKILAN